MISTDPKKKIDTLTRQIPALAKIPETERLLVFKKAFKSTSYKIYLALIVVAFILVFYFNLDNILDYDGLERGGILARSVHFLQKLGVSFFLPLMLVFVFLVLGRNYFVTKEVNNYLQRKSKQ